MKQQQQQQNKQDDLTEISEVQKTQLVTGKIFEQQPQFVRMGLYFSERFSEMQNQNVMQKYFAADLLKLQGNFRFKNQDFTGACVFYEQALSIFRFIKINKENWKKEGFADSDLEYFDENGKTEKEKRIVKGLKVILYQNICLVYLKMSAKKEAMLIDDAFQACSEAVKLDQKGSKAYYLRAKSRLFRAELGNEDYKLAIKDFKKALELDNGNSAILEELSKCQELFQAAKFTEKEKKNTTKGGKGNVMNSSCSTNGSEGGMIQEKLFDIPSEKEQQENNKKAQEFWRQFSIEKNYSNLNCDLSFEVDQNTQVPQEIRDLEEFINVRSEEIMQLYEYTGRLMEADELKKQLDKARQAKVQLENVARLDFNRPNPKLVEIALKHDINLNDEDIKQQFKSIQEQNILEIRRWLMKSGFKSYSEQGVEQLKKSIETPIRQSTCSMKTDKSVTQGNELTQPNIKRSEKEQKENNNQQIQQQQKGQQSQNTTTNITKTGITNSFNEEYHTKNLEKNNSNNLQNVHKDDKNQLSEDSVCQEQQPEEGREGENEYHDDNNRKEQEEAEEEDRYFYEDQQTPTNNIISKGDNIQDDSTFDKELINLCNEQFQESDLKLLQDELAYLLKNCTEPQGKLALQKLAQRLGQFVYQDESSSSDGDHNFEDEDSVSPDNNDQYSECSDETIEPQQKDGQFEQQNESDFQSKQNLQASEISFFKSYLGIALTITGFVVIFSFFYLFLQDEG